MPGITTCATVLGGKDEKFLWQVAVGVQSQVQSACFKVRESFRIRIKLVPLGPNNYLRILVPGQDAAIICLCSVGPDHCWSRVRQEAVTRKVIHAAKKAVQDGSFKDRVISSLRNKGHYQ